MATYQSFRIKRIQIAGLWGARSVDISFNPKVNILIGPNGSGKTTVLNFIRFVLTADVQALADTEFETITLTLEDFNARRTRTIRVTVDDSKGLIFRISGRRFAIPFHFLIERRFQFAGHRRRLEGYMEGLHSQLQDLVPAVWLPVTRRLPLPDSDTDDTPRTRQRTLESVDQRLEKLLRDLTEYRLGLEAQIARQYKDFERAALSALLHSEEVDTLTFEVPSDEEKGQLLKAFQAADLLKGGVQERIENFFVTASKAVKEFKKNPNTITSEQLRVLPLIPRTKEMALLATKMEKERVATFEPLRRFERIVNGFFKIKNVSVAEGGQLTVKDKKSPRALRVEQLSSGEKQLLILLIEALLREHQPVVYVADEPELSLHIEWQEKLLESLVELARQVQVIVATHSPDIVGPYRNNVIEMVG